MKIIKTSQSVGASKQSFKNKLYKAIAPYTKGLFSDTSWQAIQNIWKVLDNIGVDWAMTDAKYDGKVPPESKYWKFEINFTNNKGRPDKLYGVVTAHGAGSVEDPLSKYDITVVMG